MAGDRRTSDMKTIKSQTDEGVQLRNEWNEWRPTQDDEA